MSRNDEDDGFEPTILALLPYAHMDYEDGCLFYQTMNALLTYANRTLGVTDEREVVIDGGQRERQNVGARVGEMLWRNREVVNDFVDTNPCGLSREHVDTARHWYYAVRDLFTCIYADEDGLLLMNSEAIFAVGAMEQEADALIHSVPCLMIVTLLPFKGGIVTDGKVIHVSDKPKPEAAQCISRQISELIGLGVISTSQELIDYSKGITDEEWLPPDILRQLDEALGITHA